MLVREEGVVYVATAFASVFQRPQVRVLTPAGGKPPGSVTTTSNDMADIDSNAYASHL